MSAMLHQIFNDYKLKFFQHKLSFLKQIIFLSSHLTLLLSRRPKLHTILAFLSAIGLIPCCIALEVPEMLIVEFANSIGPDKADCHEPFQLDLTYFLGYKTEFFEGENWYYSKIS